MERLGAVERYCVDASWVLFRCTDAGRDAAIASHRRILAPKRKRLYAIFLRLSDSLSDLSFREFLTKAEFADIRRNA